MSTTTLTYSPFFSSGLLAPQAPPRVRRDTAASDISEPWDDAPSPSSPSSSSSFPAYPSSPISEMDVDVGHAPNPNLNLRRSATPTPSGQQDDSTPVASPQSGMHLKTTSVSSLPTLESTLANVAVTAAANRPRLRRRRSSLTQAASPMSAIRSPARAAGNAFHLQMALPTHAPGSRSRSGSINSTDGNAVGGVIGVAGPGVGRARSGSCSNVDVQSASAANGGAAGGLFRPRRLNRRNHAPLPAPAMPPPTTPLPALPSFSAAMALPPVPGPDGKIRPSELNIVGLQDMSISGMGRSPAPTSARARGLSISSSTLGGEEHTIDE